MKTTGKKSIHVGIRLPEDLVQRIDAFGALVNERTPGLDLARADAIRILLVRALEGVEREAKQRR